MVLKANDRRTSCPCHDEFRGPRSDYVRQKTITVSKVYHHKVVFTEPILREKIEFTIDKINTRKALGPKLIISRMWFRTSGTMRKKKPMDVFNLSLSSVTFCSKFGKHFTIIPVLNLNKNISKGTNYRINCGLSYRSIADSVCQDPLTDRRIWNRWVQDGNTERCAGSHRSLIKISREDIPYPH
ncbi:hypothetical protein TNCV_1928161 [Trichonephila clavipes]|nr:hypothetical protein TNCV_1928161 [Trichonephila clavipes]